MAGPRRRGGAWWALPNFRSPLPPPPLEELSPRGARRRRRRSRRSTPGSPPQHNWFATMEPGPMDLQQLHRRRAVPLPPPARRAAPPRRRSSAPLAQGGGAPPTGSGSERQSKLGIESRLKEGRGARLEGGRGGGARRRWRAGLDPAWIHREGRGAAGRICREEREGNVRGGMGKGKAAGQKWKSTVSCWFYGQL